MTLSHRLLLAALAPLSIALSACGGGSGDFLAGGGVSGTGITSGSVTGFGSVIVNQSIHGTDANTELFRNGEPVTGQVQDLFFVGDVVVIEWESDDDGVTRNATRVSYQRELFGEVTIAPDDAAGTVGVLGQTVHADATTIFDDFDEPPLPGGIFPQDLGVGDCVEVTGFRDANGNLLATRIELEGSCPTTVEIQGIVVDPVDPLPTQISVSGTLVDVAATTPISPSASALVQGAFVKVKGSFSGVELTASEIEVSDDDLSGLEDDDIDVEGIIDECSSGCGTNSDVTFSVSGIPVSTNSGTTYENGGFLNLRDGIRIEVEGTFSSGVLVADEIEFKLDGDVKLEAIVSVADPATGIVTVSFGPDILSVFTDPLITQFKDNTGTIPAFGVDDLNSGDYVKITGYGDSASLTDAVATKLELENLAVSADNDRVLQGPVDSASNPDIEILGITVDTTTFDDADFEPSGRTNFFSQVSPGDIVQAQGTALGTTITWEEVELED